MDWIAFKGWLADVTWLEKDALHIYAGVAAQLLASRFFSQRLASVWPLAVVLLLAVANEAYDIAFEVWPPADRPRQWPLGLHDILNTLAMPVLLFILARRRERSPVALRDEAA